MATQTYQTASRHLLAQARVELAAGDTRQASEKGWGAAAQIGDVHGVRFLLWGVCSTQDAGCCGHFQPAH